MKALIKIQGELKAPKNQFNKFGNYKYRSCEDILEAVKPLCIKEGALLTLSDEIVERNGSDYVQATASFICGDFKHEVTASAKHSVNQKGMSDAQMTGSASSYARKYAPPRLFCIDDTKDDDTRKPSDNASSLKKSITDSISKADTKEKLAKVFNDNKNLHGNSEFMRLMNEQKKKLK